MRQNCHLQMVRWNGIDIEIISGLGKKSPVDNILKKGSNLYHMCYSTKNFKEAISSLKKEGFLEISLTKPAKLFSNKLVVFMYHPALGIIELLEK